jgi:hypothetical protein
MEKEPKKPKYENVLKPGYGTSKDEALIAIANELAELNENLKHFQKHGVGVLNLP